MKMTAMVFYLITDFKTETKLVRINEPNFHTVGEINCDINSSIKVNIYGIVVI